MKRMKLGILTAAAVSVAGFIAYQKLQGKGGVSEGAHPKPIPSASHASQNTALHPAAAQGGKPGAVAISQVDPAEGGREHGPNWATYRELERLEAEGSPEAVDALLAHLENPNDWVKSRVLQALGKIGSPRALPGIVAMLDSKGNLLAMRGAYMAIGALGPKMGSAEDRQMAVGGLKKSLENYRKDTDQDSRGNIYVLLDSAGKIPGEEAGVFLLAELPNFHEDPLAQYAIVKALGETGYKQATDPLVHFKADLVKEGPASWGDKELYSDLLKAVDDSLARIAAR